MSSPRDLVLRAVDALADECVAFTSELVRVPTVNPPGEHYEEGARVLGERLARLGFEVEYLAAEGRPEHTPAHPRVNVVGSRGGSRPGPCLHLNGHLDVVPAGADWSVDPWTGVVREASARSRIDS